ncbi:MAG TPA: amidohydrolase family protein [Candidatus Acidoferrales bacterium]|nr:amidohydrolase family protein [Candidatus Acidoferrales bacterium]
MYDLVLRNGRIYDGSGLPSFVADLAIKNGRIEGIGRINDPTARTIDVDGLAVAPGFIDFHTHFDAQLLWDPLGSSSNEHGVTTVVTGNCGLTLAPCKPEMRDALIGTFVRVEAMPREALQAGISWEWTTHGEYMSFLDKRPKGLNIATLVGHCAVRHYVMGEDSVEREATDDEIRQMEEIVRESLSAGAFGFSSNYNQSHYREDGKPVPSRLASLDEIERLCLAVGESRRGAVQFTHGAFATPELIERLSRRYNEIAKNTRRPLIGESIRQRWSEPDLWRKQLNDVEESFRQGAATYAMTTTRPSLRRWTLKNANRFDEMPTWRKIMSLPLEIRMRELRNPETRAQLAREAVEDRQPISFSRRWDLVFVREVVKPEHKPFEGASIQQLARAQGKSIIDAFLDLALAEGLETVFQDSIAQGDEKAVAEIFRSPYVLLGQSDAGAHVANNAGFGYCTLLLGYWVRERQIMPLEEAIRKLTFMPASVLGIADRGLLRPGMAGDVVVFDPQTVDVDKQHLVYDLPTGAPRYIQHAKGIHYTIVNGSILMKNGEHTGAYPGKVLRSQ